MKRNMKIEKKKVLCLLAVASILFSGCGAKTEEIPVLLEPIEATIEGRIVTRGDIYDVKLSKGYVKSEGRSYAFSKACTVKEITVKPGDYVEAGTVLATVDESAVDTSKKLLEAEISYLTGLDEVKREIAETELAYLQMNLEAALASWNDDWIEEAQKSVTEKENQNTYEQEIRALDIEQKRQELAGVSTEQGENALVAEEAGYVVYCKNFSIENASKEVDAEEILLIVTDKEDAYIGCDMLHTNAKQATYLEAQVGNQVFPVTYAPPTDSEKKLASAADIELETKVYGDGLAELVGKPAAVYAYTNVKEQVLSVSSDSVYSENGEDFVYVIEDGAKKKTVVETGVRTAYQTEIISGLKEGDVVYYPVSDKPGNQYTLYTVERKDYSETGKFEQVRIRNKYVEVVENPVNGAVLQELKVKNGDSVKQGDELAILWVEEGQSSQVAVQAQRDNQVADFTYEQMLLSKELEKKQETMKEMEETQQSASAGSTNLLGTEKYKTLTLDTRLLTAQIKQYQIEIDYAEKCYQIQKESNAKTSGAISIKAPMDGVVKETASISVGYGMAQNEVICNIESEDGTCVAAYADDETVLPNFGTVSVNVYGREEGLSGQVISSYPALLPEVYDARRMLQETNNQITMVAYIELQDTDNYFFPDGFGVSVETLFVPDAIVIPTELVSREGDNRYVWVYREDGQIEKRYITVGHYDIEQSLVLSGLTEGEQIIAVK